MSSLKRIKSLADWEGLWKRLDDTDADPCLVFLYDGSAADHETAIAVLTGSAETGSLALMHHLLDVRESPHVFEQVKKVDPLAIPPRLLILGGGHQVILSIDGSGIKDQQLDRLMSRDEDRISVDDIRFPQGLTENIGTVVRELVQNAADACDRLAVYDPTAKREIQIELKLGSDGLYRLRISDTGDGMDRETLTTRLLRLGESGTARYREKHPSHQWRGMYGYGFVTCLAISERVVVRSQSFDPNKNGITWMWNRTKETSSSLTLLSPPSSENGTSVTLTLTEPVSRELDPNEFERTVKKRTRYVTVPVYWGNSVKPCNILRPLWDSASPDIGSMREFCRELDEQNPLHLIPITSLRTLPFRGFLFIPSRHEEGFFLTERRAEYVDLYVRGIFVCRLREDFLGPFTGLVGGVLCDDQFTPNFIRDSVIEDDAWKTHREFLRDYLEEEFADALAKNEDLYSRMEEAFPRKIEELLLKSDIIRKKTAKKTQYWTSVGPRSVEQITREVFPDGNVIVNMPFHKDSLISLLLLENKINYVQLSALNNVRLFTTQFKDHDARITISTTVLAEFILKSGTGQLDKISAYLDGLGLDHFFAHFNPPYLPAFILQLESTRVFVINTNCRQVAQLENCADRALFEYMVKDIISTAILISGKELERDEIGELIKEKVTSLKGVLADV